jgi:hypothetical protein
MNTEDMQWMLDKLKDSTTKFLVVSENEAGGKIHEWSKPLLIISNTDPSWLPGKHWVAFYFPKNDLPEFFDSFGHPPNFYTPDFSSFLKLNSPTECYIFNQWQLQSSNSNVCGLYCVLYGLSKYKKLSYVTFLNQFAPEEVHQNDLKCVHLIESNFNVKLNIDI